MSSSKRKGEEIPTQDLSSVTKRTKLPTLGFSSCATPSAPLADISEIENKTNDSSIVKLDGLTKVGTPAAAKPPLDGGPPKVHGSPISSHRSGDGPKAQELQDTIHATRSNELTKVSLIRITEMLKHELRGRAYVHAKFFEEFLELDQGIQNRVLQRVRSQATEPARSLGRVNYVDYDSTNGRWILDKVITTQDDEGEIYGPLAKALNVIGQASFEIYREMHPNDTIRKAYFPFINHPANGNRYDSPSDSIVAPNLLQGKADEQRVHWGDCEVIIECKSSSSVTHRIQAFVQLAHYVRAVFAHQIYRVAVFGFSICGSIVNFVYFDRSGMLHSPDLDLSKPNEANSFIQHIISLMTLDASKYGYDDRYSFNFQVNPPQTLFKLGNRSLEPVNDILCRRECCSGRATCVIVLGDLVLKTTWRPEEQTDEGTTMLGFKCVFGFCQLEETSSIRDTRLKYADQLKHSLATKAFVPQSRPLDSTAILRGVRVQSDLLMRRGTPLMEVQNPLHLAMAIHDALLGVMALTEVGKLHCDISPYNLLLVDPKKHYPDQNWTGQPTFEIIPDVWKRTARGSYGTKNSSTHEGQENDEYESPRLKRVKELGRGPYCVLHDAEFMADERPNEGSSEALHIDPAGTPTFISAQLLTAEHPIARTFMHDIESLFWVLLWIIVCRSQESNGPWKVSERAKELIRDLSNSELSLLGDFKMSLFAKEFGSKFGSLVLELKNPWCEDLAPLVAELGQFLYYHLYCEEEDVTFRADAAKTLALLQRDQYLDRAHLETFNHLFEILNYYIHILEKKYQVDLTEL